MRYLKKLQLLACLLAAPLPALAQEAANVRVTARVVVIDREAAARAGVSYLALGGGRVEVRPVRSGRGGAGARIGGPLGVGAFLELARERRWTRSEATQSVMVLSGAAARVASLEGGVSRYGASSRGPSLQVRPTVLPDGRVRLEVSTGVESRVDAGWGATVDAPPAWAETEVVARTGEEVVVASSAWSEEERSGGLLRIARGERGRDVLVVLTAAVLE